MELVGIWEEDEIIDDGSDEIEDKSDEIEEPIEIDPETVDGFLLNLELIRINDCYNSSSPPRPPLSRDSVLWRVESVLFHQYTAFLPGSEVTPAFETPNIRDWKNVLYHPDMGLVPSNFFGDDSMVITTITSFGVKKSRSKYLQMLFVLGKIHSLLLENSYATKRAIFYENINKTGNQGDTDSAVTTVCAMLQVPRYQLRILATAKGLITGNIRFIIDDELEVDCLNSIQNIPQHIFGMKFMATEAKFLLIVEKDATFQKLFSNRFLESVGNAGILVTAKGFPDLNTRQLVYEVHHQLGIPVLCLVDADPFGIDIMCVYRFGSLTMTWCCGNLAVTSLKWIGIHPTDLLELEEDKLVECSERDVAKLRNLLERPYVDEDIYLKYQIETMLWSLKKAEIQSVAQRECNLILYIVNKINDLQFI